MESNKRVCKACGIEKDRILVGLFNNKDKRYHDKFGNVWNGHTCGTCNRARIRLNMKLLREKRKVI